MVGLKGLRITGFIFASLALLVAMGSECFYIWKAVNPKYRCCIDELEMRTWVGIGEGIVGMILGVGLIVGFVYIIVWVLWVWVVWALGITGFNSYCIYFRFHNYCIDENGKWSTPGDDFWQFHIMVATAVCGYSLALCVLIPVSALITRKGRSKSSTLALMSYRTGQTASYSFDKNVWENDAFVMD